MPDDPDDPFNFDDFFSDKEPEGERINSFEIEHQQGWLKDHGYEPGDSIWLEWRDADGEVYAREIQLPEGDWSNPASWSDFYDEMRDFYEDIWGDGAYEGMATAG